MIGRISFEKLTSPDETIGASVGVSVSAGMAVSVEGGILVGAWVAAIDSSVGEGMGTSVG
jgi:hypothetical protein